ncbi:hypothetical protein NM688_g1676 [Phlebia brevispora]|uniref:Uncharacterized protein n=1 Tax=Phlebia brevispora TaxID=194682 RepID=A0ACC1TAM4_9APHY|nr:hypothetical protein NM688_g1676 [Phlebia brevispora]
MLCKFCKQKPVYIEDGYAHDFCGKWCASASRNGRMPLRGSPDPSRPIPNGGICRLAGCSRPVHVNADGTLSEWCSHRHRVKAVAAGKAEACLFCRQLPKAMVNGKRSDFCSTRCGRDAIDDAPIMLAVDKSHTAYENGNWFVIIFSTRLFTVLFEVTSQFRFQWLHGTPLPRIVKIWKLFGTRELTDRFMKYKLEVERRIEQLGGNSRRRWHGTTRACDLGDNDRATEFCQDQECCVCSIIRTSFDKAQFGARTNFGRFGAGIYTSATSSKVRSLLVFIEYASLPIPQETLQANDYVATKRSTYKAMLLCEVIMGNAVKLTVNHPHLTSPPRGYDSVVGEPGDDLNYDESIVYRNDAIRPLFLVIYDDGPPESEARAER